MKGFSLNKNKVLGIMMILAIWTLAYWLMGNSVIIPSPLETATAFKEILRSPSFTITMATTLTRIVISFIIGLILALILGMVSALNQWFYELLSPAVSLFKIVPTMAIVILALIWLTNRRAPILIATIIIFPILYEAVIKGIRHIDPNILSMTGVYKVAAIDIIRYIYIPSILNNLLAIFSSTLGLCLKVVIGGEVLGQPNNSIGTSIQTEKMYLNTAGVLGWLLILVILSVILDTITKIFVSAIKAVRKGLKNERPIY